MTSFGNIEFKYEIPIGTYTSIDSSDIENQLNILYQELSNVDELYNKEKKSDYLQKIQMLESQIKNIGENNTGFYKEMIKVQGCLRDLKNDINKGHVIKTDFDDDLSSVLMSVFDKEEFKKIVPNMEFKTIIEYKDEPYFEYLLILYISNFSPFRNHIDALQVIFDAGIDDDIIKKVLISGSQQGITLFPIFGEEEILIIKNKFGETFALKIVYTLFNNIVLLPSIKDTIPFLLDIFGEDKIKELLININVLYFPNNIKDIILLFNDRDQNFVMEFTKKVFINVSNHSECIGYIGEINNTNDRLNILQSGYNKSGYSSIDFETLQNISTILDPKLFLLFLGSGADMGLFQKITLKNIQSLLGDESDKKKGQQLFLNAGHSEHLLREPYEWISEIEGKEVFSFFSNKLAKNGTFSFYFIELLSKTTPTSLITTLGGVEKVSILLSIALKTHQFIGINTLLQIKNINPDIINEETEESFVKYQNIFYDSSYENNSDTFLNEDNKTVKQLMSFMSEGTYRKYVSYSRTLNTDLVSGNNKLITGRYGRVLELGIDFKNTLKKVFEIDGVFDRKKFHDFIEAKIVGRSTEVSYIINDIYNYYEEENESTIEPGKALKRSLKVFSTEELISSFGNHSINYSITFNKIYDELINRENSFDNIFNMIESSDLNDNTKIFLKGQLLIGLSARGREQEVVALLHKRPQIKKIIGQIIGYEKNNIFNSQNLLGFITGVQKMMDKSPEFTEYIVTTYLNNKEYIKFSTAIKMAFFLDPSSANHEKIGGTLSKKVQKQIEQKYKVPGEILEGKNKDILLVYSGASKGGGNERFSPEINEYKNKYSYNEIYNKEGIVILEKKGVRLVFMKYDDMSEKNEISTLLGKYTKENNVPSFSFALTTLRGHNTDTENTIKNISLISSQMLILDGGCRNYSLLGKYRDMGIKNHFIGYDDTGKGQATKEFTVNFITNVLRKDNSNYLEGGISWNDFLYTKVFHEKNTTDAKNGIGYAQKHLRRPGEIKDILLAIEKGDLDLPGI